MKNFEIDMEYVVSVSIVEEHYPKQRENETSEEFLIRKLTHGSNPVVTISSEDHPEFAKLRNQLEQEGYIKTERSWSNGDRVLKPFMLNNVKFKKNYKFCCASAMKWVLENGKASL